MTRMLLWKLTTSCNLRCSYCWEFQTAAGSRGATAHTPGITGFLAGLSRLDGLQLGLGGGEPLLSPQFVQITRDAAELGLPCKVFTNGTLVTPKLIGELGSSCPTEWCISLDAISDKVNDSDRGESSAARRGMELLQRHGSKVVVTCVASRRNLDSLPALASYCDDHGIGFDSQVVVLNPEHRLYSTLCFTTREEKLALLETFERIARTVSPRTLATFENYRSYLVGVILTSEYPDVPCPAGACYVVMDSTGNVIPCRRRADQVLIRSAFTQPATVNARLFSMFRLNSTMRACPLVGLDCLCFLRRKEWTSR